MTLATGTRLGPYEILAPLGAGGMGEVYRARDTRLGREIAVKVLPAEFSKDGERLARFEQEARAASALNHPNILTVYDVGSDAGHSFLAMELVDGKSLRELLEGGPLPQRKGLDLAVQIADGLAKAHGAGIVHRDLKPENVMVSKDGFAKILDFGLAKLVEPLRGDVSDLPTAAPATSPGLVLGTVGYMSPEQAAGQSVDYRSDQFAFGAIGYEMATGKKAFSRKTSAETLTAIIREEPKSIEELNPRVPAPIRWIVERCLSKDPDDRYASTRDLARDLKSVRDHLSEASQVSGVHAVGPARSRRIPSALLAALAAVAIGAAGMIAGRKMAPNRALAFQRLTFERGTIGGARFAPDGHLVLFSAKWNGDISKVFSTRTTSPDSSLLSLPDALLFSVSPENELAIALDAKLSGSSFQPVGTLARVPMAGGTPRELLENVGEAEWSPDGSQLAVVHDVEGKSRLELPIGKVLYETGGWVGQIRFSPDGKKLAFIDHPALGDGGMVSIVDTAGGKKRDLSTGWVSLEGDLAWRPDGGELLFSGTRAGNAWKIYGVTLAGKERLVLSAPGGVLLHDLAPDGRMLVSQDDWRAEIAALVPGANGERDFSLLDYSQVRDISPDGTVLTLDESGEGGGDKGAVYLRKTDGSPAVRLGDGAGATLSNDGKWVASTNFDDSAIQLFPTGPGQPQKIPCKNIDCNYPTFFPDGKHLTFIGIEPGHGPRIYVTPVDAMNPRAISPEGVALTTVLAVSPDGRSVAALGTDAKPAIFSVDGASSPRSIPGTDVPDAPMRWTSDGASMYISRRSGQKTVLSRVDVTSGKRTVVREISAMDPAGVRGILRVYPTPDARSYAYSYVRVLSTLYQVEGIR